MRQGVGRGARQYTISKNQKLNSSMSNSTNQDKSSDNQKVNTNLYAKEHESAPFKVDSDKMINMSPKDDSSESNENFFIDMEPPGSNISASQKKKYGLDQLNPTSTNQYGYGSTTWKYQDEENTPALKHASPEEGYELKSMTYKEATTVIRTTKSSLQDHYSSLTKDQGKPSASAYYSTYTGMETMSPQKKPHSILGDVIGHSYSQRMMPTINNDFESRDDPKSKHYAYDEMFEQAALQNIHKKDFSSHQSFGTKLKLRDDDNTIQISMSHASDSNEKADKKQGKKMKSRIGLRQFDDPHDPTSDDPHLPDSLGTSGMSLNSSQSQTFIKFMEDRDKQKKPHKKDDHSSSETNTKNYQMKSQYGQNYMKLQQQTQYKQVYMTQQKIHAQERKHNKLSNQIKEDLDMGPDDAAQKIQSQMEKRKLKKKQIQEEQESQEPFQQQTYCGNLVSSLFTEEGRQMQEQESQIVRKQSLKEIIGGAKMKEDVFQDVDGEETNIGTDAFQKETQQITQRFIQEAKNKDKKALKDHNELEDLKKELKSSTNYQYLPDLKGGGYEKVYGAEEIQRRKQEMTSSYDTVHPNKLINEISDSVSDSNRQEASKNIFSKILKNESDKINQMAYIQDHQRGVTGSSLGYGQQYKSSYNYKGNLSSYRSQTGYEPQMKNYYNDQYRGLGQHQEQPIYNVTGMNVGRQTYDGYFRDQYEHQNFQQPYTYSQSQSKQQEALAIDKYFYESPSKYISLKKFSEAHYQFQDFSKKKPKDSQAKVQSLYLQMAELKQKQNQREFCNKYNLEQWFKGLLNHEKSIVLTIIDDDLVHLIKAMHKKYVEFGHGFYYTHQVGYKPVHSVQDAAMYEKVEGYEQKLCFQKPKYQKQAYDYYGSQSNSEKEQKQYQDQLITNIRIIKVGDVEAITLSNDLIENTNYLLRMFQSVDKHFMSCELKVEKTEGRNAMEHSVFSKYSSAVEQEKNEASAQSRKKKDQDIYFTLNERDVKQGSQIKQNSQSMEFRDRHSQYGRMGTKPHPAAIPKQIIDDKSQISLGLILCHIFEKAINIQYQEFQNKTSNQMNQFFYSQNDNSIFNQDLKLAKFWQNLKSHERSSFWRKVTEAQEPLVKEIKQSELYLNMKNIDDIQEENETDTESNSRSAKGMKFSGCAKNSRFENRPGQNFNQYSEIESQECSSESDSRGSQINWGGARKSELQANRLKSKYHLNSDDQSANSSDAKLANRSHSEDDSDDIEKNQRQSFKSHFDQGYRPIKASYESFDTYGNRSKNTRGPSRSIISQPQGKGYKALDNDSETVTEYSEEEMSSNEEINRYKSTLPNQFELQQYKNQERRPVYSATQNSLDHQRDITKSDLTDYEKDKFEAQSEDDDDDDFNLPKGHEQNVYEKLEISQLNIKQKIIEQKQERQNNPKQYQSTGSQATNVAQLKAQSHNPGTKSSKKVALPKEEKKTQIQSKSQKLKTQQTIQQNKECQKENQVKKAIKILLTKLESRGSKAVPADAVNDDQNIVVLDECYLFIRQISTFGGLTNKLKKTSNLYQELVELIDQRVFENAYRLLQEEQNRKDLNDLMDEDDLNDNAVSGATAPSSKNAIKAAKKKAKKEREKLQNKQAAEAEAQAKAQEASDKEKVEDLRKDVLGLMNDHNDQLIAKTAQSSTKQISHIVNDDIVVVKDVPSEPQPSEGTKKSKRTKRGNKKNKKKDKGGEGTLDETEQDKPKEESKDENQLTKLIESNQISAIGLVEEGGIKSVAQKKAVEALADVIIQQSTDETTLVEDPEKILNVLKQQDVILRKTEGEQAEIFKKMLFPDGDFSDSSKSETSSQKFLQSCEKMKSRLEGSIKHNQSSSPTNMNDFVAQQQMQSNRYVRERTSLITEKFDKDKYPDQEEMKKLGLSKSESFTKPEKKYQSPNFYDGFGDMADMNINEKEKDSDLYLDQIGEELQNDPEMIGFHRPHFQPPQEGQQISMLSGSLGLGNLYNASYQKQKMLQQQEENKKMMSEQESLLQDLGNLSAKVTHMGEQVSQEKKQLKFTDLKQLRGEDAAPPPSEHPNLSPGKLVNPDLSLNTNKIAMDIDTMIKNKKAADYCEKAVDEDPAAVEEPKKRKKKKTKKKKKGEQSDPKEEEAKKQETIKQTEDWQKELTNALNKEKQSDEENEDDAMFDDNFMTSNPNYIQMQQIYGGKKQNEFTEWQKELTNALDKEKESDGDIVDHEEIFVNMDPHKAIEAKNKEFTVCMAKVQANYKKQLLEKSKLEQAKKSAVDKHFGIDSKKDEKKGDTYSAVLEPVEQIEVQLIDNIPTLSENKPNPSDDEADQKEVQQPQAPKLSKKAQAKLDKKKEEKQKQKLREQQKKEREAELKEQKAQKKKEIHQKKLQDMKQQDQAVQAKPAGQKKDDDNIVHTLTQKDQGLMKLPGLNVLNSDKVQQHGGGSRSESESHSIIRNTKRVTFQRDESYDESKVPKRGSSRGSSVALSNKNKEDVGLDDLDDLFAKEYKQPKEETCQSIIDSLDNSKKNSLESSTNKSGKDDREAQAQAKMLHKKLTNLVQNEDQIDSGTLKADRFRSSSGTHKKRGRSQSPSPQNEIMMQNVIKKGKTKNKKNADKSMDAKTVQQKSALVQESVEDKTPDNSSVKSSQNSKKAPAVVKQEPEVAPIKFEIIRPAPQPKLSKAQKREKKRIELELQQKTTKKQEPEEKATKESTKKKSKQTASQKEAAKSSGLQPNNLYVQAFNAASSNSQQQKQPQNTDTKIEDPPTKQQSKKKTEKQKAIVPAELPDDIDLSQGLSKILNDKPAKPPQKEAPLMQPTQNDFGQVIPIQNNALQNNMPMEMNQRVFQNPQQTQNEIVIQTSPQNIMNNSPSEQIQDMMRFMNPSQNTLTQGMQNMFQGIQQTQPSMDQGGNNNQNQTQIQVDMLRFTITQNQLPMKNDNQAMRPQNSQSMNQANSMQMFQPQQQSNSQQMQTPNQWNQSFLQNPQMPQNFGNMQNMMNMQQNLVNMQNMQNMQNSMMASNQMQQSMNLQMMQNMQNHMSQQQNQMGMPQMNQFNYSNNPNNQYKNFQGQMPQYSPQQLQSMLNQSGNFQMGFNPNANFPNMQSMNQQVMPSQSSQNQSKSQMMQSGSQPQGSSPQFTQQNNGMNFNQQPGFTSPQSQYAQQMNAYMFNNNQYKPNNQIGTSNSSNQQIMQQQTSPQKSSTQNNSSQQPQQYNQMQQAMMMNQTQMANQHNPQLFFQYQQQFQQNMQNKNSSQQNNMQSNQNLQTPVQAPQSQSQEQTQFNSQSPNFTPQNQIIQNQFSNKQKPYSGQQMPQSQQNMTGSGQKPVVRSQVIEIADQLGAVLPKQPSNLMSSDQFPMGDSQGMLQIPSNQFVNSQSSSPNQMIYNNQSPIPGNSNQAVSYNPHTGQPIQSQPNQHQNTQYFQNNNQKKGSNPKGYNSSQSNQYQNSGQNKGQPQQNTQYRFDSQKQGQQHNLQQFQNNNYNNQSQNYYSTQGFSNLLPLHQQQQMQKIQLLQSQGYVLDINDLHILNQLSVDQLKYVDEFYEVLDAQILKLKQDQEVKLQKTQRLRDIAFGVVKDQIKNVYKKRFGKSGKDHEMVKVEIYGSMATGLAIDSSDLDILVSDFIDQNSPRFKGLSRQELIEEMQVIHQALNEIFALKTNTLIESASVPVIKLQINLVKLYEREIQRDSSVQKAFGLKLQEIIDDDELKTLNIDITLNEPRKVIDEIQGPAQPSVEHLGLQCCKYIKSRLEEHQQMKTLALVFKKFLSLKGLNKPFSGGLSSYSLVQMILVILRQNKLMMFGQNMPLSIGMLFKRFIWEYGFLFQPVDTGITQDGQLLNKDEFQYIYHSITCNINLRIMEEEHIKLDGEDSKPKHKNPLDPMTCTCGFTKNQVKQTGTIHSDGTPQNSFAHILQNLLNNQNDEDSPEFKANRGAFAHLNHNQLIIVDPLNKFNNIGRSSYNFSVVQDELKQCYFRLNDELLKFCKYASSCNQIGQQSQLQDLHLDGLIPRILQIEYQIATQELPMATPQIEEDKKQSSPGSQPKKNQANKPKEEQKTKTAQASSAAPLPKATTPTPKSKKSKAKGNRN